jgi:vacuolar-type H+-ATPase subunit E/Vma4
VKSNERNTVLARLDEITETSKENVLNTLRSNLAALEERGKLLQEELISSMEEDAYVVRRASEQSLIQIREAIRDSFVAIQTAQDERMPM